jgi:excisionase family DNA binding protein
MALNMPVRLDDERATEPRDDELDTLLTVSDVAERLKVSRSWVYEHTRSRSMPRSERLPHVKLGKYVRFEARAVREFLEQKCRRA